MRVEARIWDKSNKSFLKERCTVISLKNEFIVEFFDKFSFWLKSLNTEKFLIQRHIRETDINHNMIFEGDILEIGDLAIEVFWPENEPEWTPVILNLSKETEEIPLIEKMRIVGNIFDNPSKYKDLKTQIIDSFLNKIKNVKTDSTF
jgi:hypothetical protein